MANEHSQCTTRHVPDSPRPGARGESKRDILEGKAYNLVAILKLITSLGTGAARIPKIKKLGPHHTRSDFLRARRTKPPHGED